MAKPFDYSKWDNIEVRQSTTLLVSAMHFIYLDVRVQLSDDESDLHPNIDKESWFRMKVGMRSS